MKINNIREKLILVSKAEKLKLMNQLIDLRDHRRHKPFRDLEMVFYTFDILGDYGNYRDLQRHRMVSQQRQPLSTRHGYDTPPEIINTGLDTEYRAAMELSAQVFETIFKEFPNEAQYVVPMSYKIRWYINLNLRSLVWLTEIRSTPHGHDGYRKIVQEMFRQVEMIQPNLAKYMKFVDLENYSLGRLNTEQRHEEKNSKK